MWLHAFVRTLVNQNAQSTCISDFYSNFTFNVLTESNCIDDDSPGMQTLVPASPGHVVSAGHAWALAALQCSGELKILGRMHDRLVIAGNTESHSVIS